MRLGLPGMEGFLQLVLTCEKLVLVLTAREIINCNVLESTSQLKIASVFNRESNISMTNLME